MDTPEQPERNDSFEQAAENHSQGLFAEFIAFMKDNAAWWLIPFLVVFLLVGAVTLIGASGAAPFIYALF